MKGFEQLQTAIHNHNPSEMHKTIQNGVDVNGFTDETHLMNAVHGRHEWAVRHLVYFGAKVDRAVMPSLEDFDCICETPLEAALRLGYSSMARLLAHFHTTRALHHVVPHLHPIIVDTLRVRSVCVALLGIKRRRVITLNHVDRFLVREIAIAIWVGSRHVSL